MMKRARILAVLGATTIVAASMLAGATAASASGPPSNTPGFEDPAVVSDQPGTELDTGDLNGDGLPDIVAVDNVANTLTIATNTKADPGQFTSTTVTLAGCQPVAASIADLVPGGTSEIGVACAGTNQFLLLDSAGNQITSAPGLFDEFSNQRIVKATKVNGVPAFAVGENPGVLSVFTWNGTGLAQANTIVGLQGAGLAEFYEDLTPLQVNGKPAVAWTMAADINDYETAIVPLDGSPIQYALTQTQGLRPTSITTGDFNADGLDDLFITFQDQAIVLTQQPDGTFSQSPVFDDAGGPGSIARAASFTGGCYADVVEWAGQGGEFQLENNDGNGGFGAPSQYVPRATVSDFQSVDVNGDGRPDLVYAGGSGVSVALQNTDSPIVDSPETIDGDVTAGSPVTFSVGSAPDASTVQWQSAPKGTDTWTDIAGATSADYSFPADASATGTRYRALVTTADGYSALSCPAAFDGTVTAPSTPLAPLTPANGSNTNQGGTTALANTGSDATPGVIGGAALLFAGLVAAGAAIVVRRRTFRA
jgi:hypothetical protein